METSSIVAAGWYADPAGRHEYRYWDGTDWTAHVSDGGITATEHMEPAPSPTPSLADPTPNPRTPTTSPAEPRPAVGPVAPAMARRGRQRWAVPVAAITIAVVLGLIAALVIWAPWKNPPLQQPTGLMAGPSTASSVAFSWSSPAKGTVPDKYLILRDSKVIGSVPGTFTSYWATGLPPASAFRYRVAAVRGGKRSALSPVLVVRTATPPVSAARLQGLWTVGVKLVRRGDLIGGSKRWAESWLTGPKCTAGPCAVRLSGEIAGHPFRMTLTRTGNVYTGRTRANMFPCGSGSGSFPDPATLTIRVTVTKARVESRAWTASSWAGTIVLYSPYISSGGYHCDASMQTADLSGRQ
jgi:Protein of unknown function (DUF2510)/Fibronectin type III domain